jgi:hypothetical protein
VAVVIVASAALLAWSWRGDLPNPVASHWGMSNRPDGFTSLRACLVFLVVGGLLGSAVMAAIGWFAGQSSVTRRLSAGLTVWMAGLFAALTDGMLWQQRGLADAAQMGSINAVLALAILAPIIPAIVAAALVKGDPRIVATQLVAGDAPRVHLGPTEQAVWSQHISGTTALIALAAGAALTAGLGLGMRIWALLPLPVLLILFGLAMVSFTVRVDQRGLTIRSGLGWPRITIPADEVVEAEATTIRPLADFGGWGWRVGRGGRLGVVLRQGPALEVERTGGRSLVVTVDDPATGAALLNTYADRARTLR